MEIKQELLLGINEVADVVKTTLGAMGKTVAIRDDFGMNFRLTKDGVTVSRHVKVEGDIKNIGALLLQEATNKTVEDAGDGTTNTAILVQAFCNNIYRLLELGENPKELRDELDKDLNLLIEYIDSRSKKINSVDEIRKIANISANGESDIAEIISDIYDKLGMKVEISIKESPDERTFSEIATGFKLENTGYVNNIFINNHDRGTIELENPDIFILDDRISSIEPLVEIFFTKNKPDCKPLVILCNSITDVELAKIIGEMTRNNIYNIYVLTSDMYPYQTEAYFNDLAHFTGGDYNRNKIGKFGTCEKLIASKNEVYFFNGGGDFSTHLFNLEKEAESDEKQLLKDRILNLKGGAGIIFVGGVTPSEAKEREDRVDDAVKAVKSSITDGYVPGGSSIFLDARRDLELSKCTKDVLLSVYKQLLINANYDPMYYLERVENSEKGYAFNVLTGKVEDMEEKGIIESAKVVKSALINSISVAKTFIDLEKVI